MVRGIGCGRNVSSTRNYLRFCKKDNPNAVLMPRKSILQEIGVPFRSGSFQGCIIVAIKPAARATFMASGTHYMRPVSGQYSRKEENCLKFVRMELWARWLTPHVGSIARDK